MKLVRVKESNIVTHLFASNPPPTNQPPSCLASHPSTRSEAPGQWAYTALHIGRTPSASSHTRSERYSRFPPELAGASNVRSSCALSAGEQLHCECSFRVLRSSRQLVHWDTGRPFFLTSKSGRSVWWQLDERCPLMQDSLGVHKGWEGEEGEEECDAPSVLLVIDEWLGGSLLGVISRRCDEGGAP